MLPRISNLEATTLLVAAGGLDGRPPNIQEASQPMHEDRESCRRMTPVTHRPAWGRTSMSESSPGSLHPCSRAIRNRALVGSEGRQPARRPPTTPQSKSHVNPGCTANNSGRHADARLQAHTCGGGPCRLTTPVCIKAGKPVRMLLGERAPQLP